MLVSPFLFYDNHAIKPSRKITMYDAFLSCIHQIHQLKTLPMDHEPSREDLWAAVLKMDSVLRLATADHPDFTRQIREVMSEWGTNDLIECCLDGGVDTNSWINMFAEQSEQLEEYCNVSGCRCDVPNIKGS